MKMVIAISLFVLSLTSAYAASDNLKVGERVVVSKGVFGIVSSIAGDLAELALLEPLPCTGCYVTTSKIDDLHRETKALKGFKTGDKVILGRGIAGIIERMYENGEVEVLLLRPYPCSGCAITYHSIDRLAPYMAELDGFKIGDQVIFGTALGAITELYVKQKYVNAMHSTNSARVKWFGSYAKYNDSVVETSAIKAVRTAQ